MDINQNRLDCDLKSRQSDFFGVLLGIAYRSLYLWRNVHALDSGLSHSASLPVKLTTEYLQNGLRKSRFMTYTVHKANFCTTKRHVLILVNCDAQRS